MKLPIIAGVTILFSAFISAEPAAAFPGHVSCRDAALMTAANAQLLTGLGEVASTLAPVNDETQLEQETLCEQK